MSSLAQIIFQEILWFLKYILGPRGWCNYRPTCTEYALSMLTTEPLHRAIFLIIIRVILCNPLSNFASLFGIVLSESVCLRIKRL